MHSTYSDGWGAEDAALQNRRKKIITGKTWPFICRLLASQTSEHFWFEPTDATMFVDAKIVKQS